MIYAYQTWALRKKEQDIIESTEMTMLRWILGIRRVEKIRNEDVRVRARVINVREKMRETRLR